MNYLILFFASAALSVLLVPLIKKLALRIGAVDVPSSARKIHTTPIPLLGGWAIITAFLVITAVYIFGFKPDLNFVPLKFFAGIGLGALILMIGGMLDDKYNLPARYAFVAPVLAALALIFSGVGVGINVITNPLGGEPISLAYVVFGIPFSAIFIFFYVLGMIYTTKFLDGLDGLASGISFIGGLTMFFLSLSPQVQQSITASVTIIFCGAVLGFLFYNFNPASIFLGESGSTFVGFMLAAISVLLGAKIATAVLVMGIPILDVAWVIIRRLSQKTSPFVADRKHLHFRLLDIGFSQRQTVIILYCIALAFGATALILQSFGKFVSLIVLAIVMLTLAVTSVVVFNKQHAKQ